MVAGTAALSTTRCSGYYLSGPALSGRRRGGGEGGQGGDSDGVVVDL